MAILNLTKNTTVEALRKEFNDAFGAQIKLYNGNKKAEMSDTLGSLGLTTEGEFECRSSITVASFTDRMAQNHGLKVKVYTCDEWVAVLDGLTLESAGKVKKNAVKADMESMIAYQRTDSDTETPVAQVKKSASCGDYTIDILADNKVIAKKGGAVCDNAKGTMREIAAQVGFAVDANWTTQQLGSKLVDFLKTGAKPVVDTAKLEAEKAKAAAEKAAAEKAKADAEKAKLDAEKAAAQKAKAEAEAAQAELERMKAEAAAAKAEAEKAKAEAEKAKAAAEKAAADKAKAEAEKTTAEAAAAKPAATGSNKGAMPGLFSVASNKKVRFSMGNLQFNPKKYEFRFALHQYDIIGTDNTKIAPNYDGWIDLFGYGTSGYMGCEPTEVSVTASQYPNTNIANTNYDWGVYNPISNGGNKEGIWRTMTKEELEYLFNTRPNAAKLRARACVNGIKGLIILPDDFYEHRVRVPFDSTPSDFSGNSYDLTQWATLEAAGAIFLPAAGYRSGTRVDNVGSYGYYWTATYLVYKYKVNLLWFNSTYIYYSSGETESYHASSVRLVQDVK